MHYSIPGISSRLLDGVIGPSVDKAALQLLVRNKLRVVINPALNELGKDSLDAARRLRPVRGGLLEQPNYTYTLDFNDPELTASGELNDKTKQDLILAWGVGCTSNSNTISLVKDSQLIGNGVGQQDRVGAAQLALTRTNNAFPEIVKNSGLVTLKIELESLKLDGAAAYSDSFFPFADGPELLARAGIKTILSSSGSLGDKNVKDMMKKYGVNLVMVPDKKARGFYMH
jgi:phosphoribosylaminoimidazolecarboxamide formyltransferase/IMP cyclohydrolase